MANLIDGREYSSFGLIIKSYKNLFNMPSRIGDAFYDWGDIIQPLVGASDIHWKHNDIKIECLFDGGRYGLDLEATLQELRGLKETTLEVDNHPVFDVVLKEVIEVKQKGQYAFLTIVMEQAVDDFSVPASLPTIEGGNGFNINGYDLYNSFGIIVKETKYLDNIPEYTLSGETVYNIPKKKSKIRKWGTFKIYCAMQRSDAEKLLGFKKVLAEPELNTIGYRGFSYDCFLSKGFEVVFKKSIIEFVLELNVGVRQPTISVFGNGMKIPNGKIATDVSDDTNFGSFDIRGSSLIHTFTIQNDGDGALNVGAVSVIGDSAFSISTQPSGSVSGGGSTIFRVEFNPTIYPKNYSAKIYFENSDILFSPFTFHVSGSSYDSSLAGTLEIRGNNIVIPSSDNIPSLTDGSEFPETELKIATSSSFVLRNTGTKTLEILDISLLSGDIPFSIASTSSSGLAINGTNALTVSFRHNVIGTFTDRVLVQWRNGRDSTVYTSHINVSASVIETTTFPEVEVRYVGTQKPEVDDPFEGDVISYGSAANLLLGTIFPDTKLNTPSTKHYYRVRNDSVEYLTGFSIFNGLGFSLSVDWTSPISPNGFAIIEVSFSPISVGLFSGQLQIKTPSKTWFCHIEGTGTPEDELKMIQFTGKNDINIRLDGTNYMSTLDGTDYGQIPTLDIPSNGSGFILKNIGNVAIDFTVSTILLDVNGDPDTLGYWEILFDIPNGLLYPSESVPFVVTYLGGGFIGRPMFVTAFLDNGDVSFKINLQATEIL